MAMFTYGVRIEAPSQHKLNATIIDLKFHPRKRFSKCVWSFFFKYTRDTLTHTHHTHAPLQTWVRPKHTPNLKWEAKTLRSVSTRFDH